jgi:hypothetical protein
MRAANSMLGATAAAVVFAACGGAAQAPRSAASEWTANAVGVIDQLRADAVAASDEDSISSARAALHDESRLYALLVAYSDFGGCRHMVGAAGDPPPGFRGVEATLARACASLQRAAALFTRAASKSDAPALLAASRTVLAAAPLLERAELELESASRLRR